jgi:hypothetical protein
MRVPDFAPASFLVGRVNLDPALAAIPHLYAMVFQIRELDGLIAIWAEDFHSQLWLTKQLDHAGVISERQRG